MKNLIMTGFIVLCSITSFAGNGEAEINQMNISNIENSINDIQVLNDNEPTYIYKFSVWFYITDESGTGTDYGHEIAISENCITEAEMEIMRNLYLQIYQLQYPNDNVGIMVHEEEQCN